MDAVSAAYQKYDTYINAQPEHLRHGFLSGMLDSPTLCAITKEIVLAELEAVENRSRIKVTE